MGMSCGWVRQALGVWARLSACGLVLFGVVLIGCVTSSGREAPLTAARLSEGVDRLMRPLPGNPVAMYRVRVPESGGLRLVVQTTDDGGRFLVSEPFGAAVALTTWDAGSGSAQLYDLKAGCALPGTALPVLELEDLPPDDLVRVLGGKLPTAVGGEPCRVVGPRSGAAADVQTPTCVAQIASDPWRVVELRGGEGARSWRVELEEHTVSVPGTIRVEWGGGEWAELELVRLEWDTLAQLPDPPDLPPCQMED